MFLARPENAIHPSSTLLSSKSRIKRGRSGKQGGRGRGRRREERQGKIMSTSRMERADLWGLPSLADQF